MKKQEFNRMIYEASLHFRDIPLPDTISELVRLKRRRRRRRRATLIAGTAAAMAAITALLFSPPRFLEPAGDTMEAFGDDIPSAYIVDEQGNMTYISDISKEIEYAERDGKKALRYLQEALPEAEAHTYSLIVPKGADLRLTLGDGSIVLVNSGSCIIYTSHFPTDGERVVTLAYGEAFFDVAHDEERPFIVRTTLSDTKALGTRFNVKAYGTESCDITLVEGSVAVKQTLGEWDDGLILKPGNNAVVTQHEIKVSEVELRKHVSWIEGYYFYDRESVASILESIRDRYDYRIDIFESSEDKLHTLVHFWFDRNEDIENVIERLARVVGVEIEIDEYNTINIK